MDVIRPALVLASLLSLSWLEDVWQSITVSHDTFFKYFIDVYPVLLIIYFVIIVPKEKNKFKKTH